MIKSTTLRTVILLQDQVVSVTFLFHSISASALQWSVNPEKHRVISD